MKAIYWLFIFASSFIQGISYAKEFDATIDLPSPLELSIPVSGVINKVNIAIGQRVKKGDELLTLDPAPFLTAKKRAKSQLIVQQVTLQESRRNLKQHQELYDRTVLAMVELENANLKVKRDSALLENARTKVAAAEYAYSHSKLIAPFDALILAIHVNQGQSINNKLQSNTLVSLVKQEHYLAKFNVSSDELGKFDIGNKVTIKANGNEYPGTVSSIFYKPIHSDSHKLYMIEANFISQKQKMPVGQQAVVITN